MTCAIIPTYNNAATIGDIIVRTALIIKDIIVVIDGATDNTRTILQSIPLHLQIIDYQSNKGKGYALKQGLKKAIELGFTHALTIDSDGQHLPEEIPKLLHASQQYPTHFIIGFRQVSSGVQPNRNRVANRISNFWFYAQTGTHLIDTQSGMRIYPLQHLHGLSWLSNRYEAELALLVYAAWAGEKFMQIPINVHYQPQEEQISHFRPLCDFLRITVLNTCLSLLAFMVVWPWRGLKRIGRSILLGLCLLPLFLNGAHPRPIEGYKRLYAFPASPSTNTGFAVLVCPGGSYSWLSMQTEGFKVASWLQSNGINAFVLRYRVTTVSAYILGYRIFGLGNKYPNMLLDVQDALKYVYDNHIDYQIDTSKIGIMGFSAGGHLAMSAFLYNNTPFKPKFIASIYPVVTMSEPFAHRRSRRAALGVWEQFNKTMRDSLSLEKNLPTTMPPIFLVNCHDDPIVDYRNSLLLHDSLLAHGINHTFLHFQTGGHGFGSDSTKTTPEAIRWKDTFLLWLQDF